MEKLTLQMIADKLAATSGIQKKTADAVSKLLFDTIIQGLQTDGMVKVNGLGIFKVVEVAERESVNVNNGERIVIPGYKKISFTPSVEASKEPAVDSKAAEAVKELLAVINAPRKVQETDSADDEPELIPEIPIEAAYTLSELADIPAETKAPIVAEAPTVAETPTATEAPTVAETPSPTETPIATETVSPAETPTTPTHLQEIAPSSEASATESDAEIEELVHESPELSNVEIPDDEFSQIDMIISTPESIEETRLQLEQARKRADETLIEAKEAYKEAFRLTKLLARLEANSEPEDTPQNSNPQQITENEDDPIILDPIIPDPSAEEPDAENAVEDNHEDVTAGEEKTEDDALQRYLNDNPEVEPATESRKRNYTWLLWVLVPILGAMLAGGLIFIYLQQKLAEAEALEAAQRHKQELLDKKKEEALQIRKKKEEALQIRIDDQQAKTDSTPVAASSADANKSPVAPSSAGANKAPVAPSSADAKKAPGAAASAGATPPSAPKTYVIQTGDNLYRISRKFYHTNDSVRAILRINKFKDPDNIPQGTTIKLP